VLKGEPTKTKAERPALAREAYVANGCAATARRWADAPAADAGLADDRQAGHRYNAACTAALAASGAGEG
jgi:hypothetical protein